MVPKMQRSGKFNFSAYVAQASILLLIYFVLFLFQVENYIIIGTAFYFLFSIYLKVLIPKWHRKGVFMVKKRNLQGAILCFEKSYDYFKQNNWIDRYRAFTLFSTSYQSYMEMALVNIIYCYQQLGDQQSAKKYMNKLEEEFPGNKIL